jgi:thiamine biosynthesis lipoprotein
MGTAMSLTFEDASPEQGALRTIDDVFDRYDAVFSLYKPNSELSRIADGRLALPNASGELREVYAAALEWRAATNGDFSPHRPDGIIDLSGIVKGIAMHRAGEELLRAGSTNWCLNVGGDVLVSGMDAGGAPWTLGIVDPDDRNTLLTTPALRGSRRAAATSGSAERGDHIWTVGAMPAEFVQATVLADDIVTADVLATAIVAGGSSALDQICATWNIDVMAVDLDGEIRMTPGFAPRILSD